MAPVGCEQLTAFWDQLLSPEEAEAFRRHFATCDSCNRRLQGLMNLDGLLERNQAQRRKDQVLELLWVTLIAFLVTASLIALCGRLR